MHAVGSRRLHRGRSAGRCCAGPLDQTWARMGQMTESSVHDLSADLNGASTGTSQLATGEIGPAVIGARAASQPAVAVFPYGQLVVVTTEDNRIFYTKHSLSLGK